MARLEEVFKISVYIILLVFSFFLIYQIILKILGGSWQTENIIIALMILMIGFIFNITIKLSKLETNFNNLKYSFCSLAKDFKQHLTSI